MSDRLAPGIRHNAARIVRAIAFVVLVLSWLEQALRIMQLEEENENLRNS